MAASAFYTDGVWFLKSAGQITMEGSLVDANVQADLEELIDWCQEDDRSGFFDYGYGNRVKDRYTFVFTDPDTAFEFKIRWG